jgi:hypothetical protein
MPGHVLAALRQLRQYPKKGTRYCASCHYRWTQARCRTCAKPVCLACACGKASRRHCPACRAREA